MKQVFASMALGVLLASPVAAEDVMFDYVTLLGPADAVNSRGAPLDDLCAIAQQDRANWHRLGNREQPDNGDPFFDSPDRRALFASLCVYDRGYFANAGQRIRSGSRSFYVYVRVFGVNGSVSRIALSEGAG